MEIIPAINCSNFECVKEKLSKAGEFLPKDGWVQFDISDGKFTSYKTWNNSEELRELRIRNDKSGILNLNLEIHLMVEDPEAVIGGWVKAGAKRILLHAEAIVNNHEFATNVSESQKASIEVGVAISPETPIDKLEPYLDDIKFAQVLAVPPGKSGQKFDERVLGKIKFLKQNYPGVIIEVDGGINLETAKLCEEAGADILVVGSYIWDSADQKAAFQNILKI